MYLCSLPSLHWYFGYALRNTFLAGSFFGVLCLFIFSLGRQFSAYQFDRQLVSFLLSLYHAQGRWGFAGCWRSAGPIGALEDLRAYFDQKFSHLKSEFLDDQARSSSSLVKKLKSETNLTFRFSGNKKQFEFNTETLEYKQSLTFVQSLKFIVDLEDSDNRDVSALILKLVESLNAASKAVRRQNKLIRIADKYEAGWAAVDHYLSDIHTELTIVGWYEALFSTHVNHVSVSSTNGIGPTQGQKEIATRPTFQCKKVTLPCTWPAYIHILFIYTR